MSEKREITREDLLPLEQYEKVRKERRKDLVAKKKDRRVAVGPHCTFHFENYDTMWAQVMEMLFIEKGGEAQIDDELSAYNPLIPQGRELVATVLFEIEDKVERHKFLAKLGGVEETAFIRVNGETIEGKPEEDVDRTTADGKASSVQFIHFPFTDSAIEAFKQSGAEVEVGFTHPQYRHTVGLTEEQRAALAEDFD
ncbi:MAG: DUF3501 family protein [Rhodovibrionaceae bacterium]|nr:DUF3501 family protein [Rhodovibrionaceae bacterium]